MKCTIPEMEKDFLIMFHGLDESETILQCGYEPLKNLPVVEVSRDGFDAVGLRSRLDDLNVGGNEFLIPFYLVYVELHLEIIQFNFVPSTQRSIYLITYSWSHFAIFGEERNALLDTADAVTDHTRFRTALTRYETVLGFCGAAIVPATRSGVLHHHTRKIVFYSIFGEILT